jgi:hypothetical protein
MMTFGSSNFMAPRRCPARCFHIGENRSAKVVGFFVGFWPRLVGIRPISFRFIPNWLLCPALNSLLEALGISGFIRAFIGDPGRNRTCDLQLRRLLLYPLSYGAEGQVPTWHS